MFMSKIMPTSEYTLNFDGCSKGNPGPSGAGAVLYHNDEEIWSAFAFVGYNSTNNEAEYAGLIMGLEEASRLEIPSLLVNGDSQLVIRQMRGEYKVKATTLVNPYKKAKVLEKNFQTITYNHVYRNNNVRADKLSNMGLQVVDSSLG